MVGGFISQSFLSNASKHPQCPISLPIGYQGIHCQRQNIDCASGGSELCGHGTCLQTGATYKCLCDPGWTTNGVSSQCTTDINECLSEKPHCSKDPLVDCINLPGTYRCGSCPAGYTGNGFYCTDINECDRHNGGCSIAPLVQCFNTPGSYYCGSCPLGYTGDGRSCQGESGRLGLCSRGVCHHLATCTEIGNNVNCQCPPAYVGHGMGTTGCRLNTVDPPCPLYPCGNGGTCNNATNTCSCPAGFAPPYCEPNSCSSSPCQNGGTCVQDRLSATNFRCTCPENFEGRLCDRQKSGCNAVLRGETGVLTYPFNNSTQYSEHARCTWMIVTDPTRVLNITFTKFGIEDSASCMFDYLQIHDGVNSAANLLGRFCGTTKPLGGSFLSTINSLYLFFRSDASNNHDGFTISWTSTEPGCGFTKDVTEFGTISSPGSPGNYPPNRDCWWRLTAPQGKLIQFHFLTMKIESHVDCAFDYLEIRDGLTMESPVIEKYCNTSHPAPVTSATNEVSLHFHSDADSTDTGFQIHYTVIEGMPGCGGIFTGLAGDISSPSAGGAYHHNLECEYLIQVPAGSRISLTFQEFELEHDSSCNFDYLEIYEGASTLGNMIRRYCGSTIPPAYNSQGNKLLLKFKTDQSVSQKGFRLAYSLSE